LTWAEDTNYYAIEEPTSLNTLELLPELMKMGVRAIKIEGRQRSPAYAAQVTKVWREAIDNCLASPLALRPQDRLDGQPRPSGRGPAAHLGRLPPAMEIRTMSSLKLSLGALQYYWPRQTIFDFYEAIAASPVDIVYLGETVCSRRHELRLSDWIDMADLMRDSGKEAVLSTQVLLESGVEVSAMHKVTANPDYLIEANDMGAVQRLAGQRSFVGGLHLNIYNQPSLTWLASLGATRWVAPLEMKHQDLSALIEAGPQNLQTEVFAYGRMPLAFSARCFTARQRNLPKDDCQFACMDHPDGLMLKTRESQDFLVLNGIQTQSARVHNLIDELPRMQRMGVAVARISPQAQHTSEIVALFDAVRRRRAGGRTTPAPNSSPWCPTRAATATGTASPAWTWWRHRRWRPPDTQAMRLKKYK
jgi:collagenase-like PrtC family protease